MSDSFLPESPRSLHMEDNSYDDDFLLNYNKVLAISSDFNSDFQYYHTNQKTLALQN